MEPLEALRYKSNTRRTSFKLVILGVSLCPSDLIYKCLQTVVVLFNRDWIQKGQISRLITSVVIFTSATKVDLSQFNEVMAQSDAVAHY